MKNTKLQFFVGLLLTLIFLYIALRPVNFSDLLAALRSFNWFWCLPFLAIIWLGFWLRVVRWKYILLPTKKFSSSTLFSPLIAGFGLNNLFPARLGEFARAYILYRKSDVPFITGLGTVVIERLFDMLLLLFFLVVALSNTNIPPDFQLKYGSFSISGSTITMLSHKLTILCVIVLICAVLFLIPQVRQLFEMIISKSVFLKQKYRDILLKLLHSFSDGLQSLKSPSAWFGIVFYSFGTWLCCGFSFYILSFGFNGFTLTFSQAIAVMVITSIAIILPAAPGFWGLHELGTMFGLLVLNILPNTPEGRADALAYAFINHFLNYASIVPAGLICLWHVKINVKDISQAKSNENKL